MLSESSLESRKQGRQAMKIIFDLSRTMARQGLPFRGHEASEGNFHQLIQNQVREISNSEGSPYLERWLTRKCDWTSADSQNDILQILYRGVMRNVVGEINRGQGRDYSLLLSMRRRTFVTRNRFQFAFVMSQLILFL